LTLDADVAVKVRSQMRLSGRSLNETINRVLRAGFKAASKKKRLPRFKVRARDLGLRPGLNYDKPWVLLEQLEGPLYK
jgi:hypothetical protein